jgi:hypothetical protein
MMAQVIRLARAEPAAWRPCPPSGIHDGEKQNERRCARATCYLPCSWNGAVPCSTGRVRRRRGRSAEGAAVTVFKATKSCFGNIVEVSGTIIAREETQVRPERFGLKVSEVLADAGDTVTAGQVLARLTLPEGGRLRCRPRWPV